MRSEIANKMDWDQVRYSVVWEDWRMLQQALEIRADDDVLSISSAGDNAFALLLEQPRSVTCVDLNPAQNALVALKVAAIKAFDRDAFVAFLGLRPSDDRWRLFERIAGELEPDVAAYWAEQRAAIETGVIHAGRLETFFRGFQTGPLRDCHSAETIEQLLRFDDIDAQAAYFGEVVATPDFASAFADYFSEENMGSHGRDPAQYEHVGALDSGAYFWTRFVDCCTRLPMARNFYMQFFLSSRYLDLEQGPRYLRSAEYERLRGLLDRLDLRTAQLEEVLAEAGPGRYSKANLSNIFEYTSDLLAEQMLRRFSDALRPGGRIAYWNLLVSRSCPERLLDRIEPLTELADRLWYTDRSWFYRAFRVEAMRA